MVRAATSSPQQPWTGKAAKVCRQAMDSDPVTPGNTQSHDMYACGKSCIIDSKNNSNCAVWYLLMPKIKQNMGNTGQKWWVNASAGF